MLKKEYLISFLALISSILGGIFIFQAGYFLDSTSQAEAEKARAPKFILTKITTPDCANCVNPEVYIESLKAEDVNLEKEVSYPYNSKEGQEIIKKLGIVKVPTYVLKGEVNKSNIVQYLDKIGKKEGDYFYYSAIDPLYVDPRSGRLVGEISLIGVSDPSCSLCSDVNNLIEFYKKAGLKIKEEELVDSNSPRGVELIQKYKITALPTLIMSSDLRYYNVGLNAYNVGTFEPDGMYVLRNPFPPFKTPETQEVSGLVEATYIQDDSCSTCQKVLFDLIEQTYKIRVVNKKIVLSGSHQGESLISKYDIKSVPTLLLSPSISDYKDQIPGLNSLGKFGEDGWYILRELGRIRGIEYKDLGTGNVVKTESP